MNKCKPFLLIFLSTFIATSSFAWDSKCKIKLKIKVENLNNPDYAYCLGDRMEEGDGHFYVVRSHMFRNISEKICKNEITDMLIGQKIEVPFTEHLFSLGEEAFKYSCKGTIENIKNIKFKAQKGFIYN